MAEKRIHIKFVDVLSGEVFGQMYYRENRVPRSFTEGTRFYLQGSEWQVVAAKPASRAEVIEAGSVNLLVRCVSEGASMHEINYSTPTICNDIPVAREVKGATRAALILKQDDWRQIEFVSQACEMEIGRELTAIERVCQEEELPDGRGYRWLHVRSGISRPLKGIEMTLAILLQKMGRESIDLALQDLALRVPNGFSFRTDASLWIYGVLAKQHVQVLGVFTKRLRSADDAALVAELMTLFDLKLIDWCARKVIVPGPQLKSKVKDFLSQSVVS